MRFMLLQNYAPTGSGAPPASEWSPDDIRAHIAFQQELDERLAELGELIDAVGLAGPEAARFVTSDGNGPPVVTDGPYAEAKELLAGYRLIDVDSWDRAIEIAAIASAAPGPGGVPIQEHIEVRQVMGAPVPDDLLIATPGDPDERRLDRLLREHAPRALAIVASRYGDFDGAEDAVQEALIAAADQWRSGDAGGGIPDDPRAWLVTVASRRLIDAYRSADARRRREREAWEDRPALAADEAGTGDTDDSLTLVLLCCHPALTPGAAIPLTLRAVGGLTTREIAAAFLVPEATMAQRISRAKSTLRAAGGRFEPPPDDARHERMRSALHVLYLMFNEAYVASEGDDLARPDLAAEAIRLTRMLHASLPDEPEVAGLLALMLLTEARRPARVDKAGRLVPLPEQDRTRWNRALIAEGVVLLTDAMRRGEVGEYQLQAAIAAVHDQAPTYADTDWGRIAGLYRALVRLTANPMVGLNSAVAVAMTEGIPAGLATTDAAAAALGDHHRVHAVRAHLYELAGDAERALDEFDAAAARTANEAERRYLRDAASRLSSGVRKIRGEISADDVENGGSAPTT